MLEGTVIAFHVVPPFWLTTTRWSNTEEIDP